MDVFCLPATTEPVGASESLHARAGARGEPQLSLIYAGRQRFIPFSSLALPSIAPTPCTWSVIHCATAAGDLGQPAHLHASIAADGRPSAVGMPCLQVTTESSARKKRACRHASFSG